MYKNHIKQENPYACHALRSGERACQEHRETVLAAGIHGPQAVPGVTGPRQQTSALRCGCLEPPSRYPGSRVIMRGGLPRLPTEGSTHRRRGLGCICRPDFEIAGMGEKTKRIFSGLRKGHLFDIWLPHTFTALLPTSHPNTQTCLATRLSTYLLSSSVKMLFHQKNKSQLGFQRKVGIICTYVYMTDGYRHS